MSINNKIMIQAIPTMYNGVQFRSRTEAKVAVLLDLLKIKWQYELEGYQLSSGDWYLPDFWLPELDCFWEVKGVKPNKIDERKIETLVKDSKKICILSIGNQVNNFETIEYSYEYIDYADYPYDREYINKQKFLFNDVNKKIYLDYDNCYYYAEACKNPYEAINSDCLEIAGRGELPKGWGNIICFLAHTFDNATASPVGVLDYLRYAESQGKIYGIEPSFAIDPRRYLKIFILLGQAMNYKFH